MPRPARNPAAELKLPPQILEADPYAWSAIHTALVHAARALARGENDLLGVALEALRHTHEAGFRSREDQSKTRFTGQAIMAWQDALYVVNELPEWRFPDEVLLIGWMVECGGPEMGRGPATASFHKSGPEHYVGGTRRLYNGGNHGNGAGWPRSGRWTAADCRWMTQ